MYILYIICHILLIRLVVDYVDALRSDSKVTWNYFSLTSIHFNIHCLSICPLSNLYSLPFYLTSKLAYRGYAIFTTFTSLRDNGLLISQWHWDIFFIYFPFLFVVVFCFFGTWPLLFAFVQFTYFTLGEVHFRRAYMKTINIYIYMILFSYWKFSFLLLF